MTNRGALLLATLLLLGACASQGTPSTDNPDGPPGDPGSCTDGKYMCGADCVDVSTSFENCGRCGRRCGDSQVCVGGACKDQSGDCRKDGCPSGYFCDLNSGSCKQGCGTNTDCRTREVCNIATRRCECDANSHQCGGMCVDNNDVATCGTRCTPCPTDPNGRSFCDRGECKIQCNMGFYVCPGVNACSQCCNDGHCRMPGTICQNNACVMGKRCMNTSECGIDQLCQMGTCTTVAAGGACMKHADCPNGQVCQADKCAVVNCPPAYHGWALSTCPSGTGCRRDRCTNLIDAPCRTWADCGSDYNCSAGRCSTLIPGAQDCKTNTNCTQYRGGYQCVNGHCLSVSGSSTCQADRECPFNYYCGIINKTPNTTRTCSFICPSMGYPSCAAGYSYTCMSINCGIGSMRYTCCENHHRSCVGDSDCRGGHKCINMRCTSARACATTSSCPFAEYCEGGVCKFMSSRMCMADADCGNGQVCVAGVCAPEFEAPRWM